MDDIKKLKQLEKRHTPYLMVSVPAFLFWLGWSLSVTFMYLVLALR